MSYIRLYTSVHSQVYTSPTIRFNMMARHVKSIYTNLARVKSTLHNIRYYLAAKIDFTRKPILAAPDLQSLTQNLT